MLGKLPAGIVFPVSKSILKSRLSQAPQIEQINFRSRFYKGMSERRLGQTKFGRAGKLTPRDHSVPLIEADFEIFAVEKDTPGAVLEENSRMNRYTKHEWTVTVRAIPEHHLSKVRECLESEGYKKLVDWLFANHNLSGGVHRQTLTISFLADKLLYRTSERR